jgi:hypothetical protein
MAALVAVLAIVTALFGERIGINGGQGWDGEQYVRWVAHFKIHLVERGTDAYHAQRVLPSGILHLVMRALGIRGTVTQMIDLFYWFDAVMLVIAAVLWSHLGEVMRWRPISVWVGFAGMFGSFALARHALYDPALTDCAAFALGMAIAWAYLARRPVVLWLCTGLAMFTWPGLVPVGAACLLMPRLDTAVPLPPPRTTRWVKLACAGLALALTTAFLLASRYYLAHPDGALGIPKFAAWVRRDWLVITVPLVFALLALGWYTVLDQPPLWNARAYLGTVRPRATAIAAGGLAALFVARHVWMHAVVTQLDGPTLSSFLCQQTLESLRGPLWGPVHHVVYMGPLVALAIVHWRRVVAIAGAWGHGAVAAFAMLVMFGAASESRQWIHLLPFLAAAVVAATDERWTVRRALVFVAVVLVWSKLWFRIGYTQPGDWLELPAQSYFMHLGPWASTTAWAVHGAAALVTTVGLWLLLRGGRDAARRVDDGERA